MKNFSMFLFAVSLIACGTVSTTKSMEDGDPNHTFKVLDSNVGDTGRVAMQVGAANALQDVAKGRRARDEASAALTMSYVPVYQAYMAAVGEYGNGRSSSEKQRKAQAEAYAKGYRSGLAAVPPAPPPALAAPALVPTAVAPSPPAVTSAPTVVAPAPIENKKGKTTALAPVAPAPTATPQASIVGTDLRSGIDQAKDLQQLASVFEREAADAGNPKSGEYRNIASSIKIEAANGNDPKSFDRVKKAISAAYGR